jgi:hypothetical protein
MDALAEAHHLEEQQLVILLQLLVHQVHADKVFLQGAAAFAGALAVLLSGATVDGPQVFGQALRKLAHARPPRPRWWYGWDGHAGFNRLGSGRGCGAAQAVAVASFGIAAGFACCCFPLPRHCNGRQAGGAGIWHGGGGGGGGGQQVHFVNVGVLRK